LTLKNEKGIQPASIILAAEQVFAYAVNSAKHFFTWINVEQFDVKAAADYVWP
jgi:hypothetical protein